MFVKDFGPYYIESLVERLKAAQDSTTILDRLEDAFQDDSQLLPFIKGLKKMEGLKSDVFGGVVNLQPLLEIIRSEKDLEDFACPLCNNKKPISQLQRSGHVSDSKCRHDKLV